jgi:ribosomal protein L16
MRGTTVVWGDYGIRMRDHDRRISAHQLRVAEETIKKRLRGMKFRLYMRIAANIGVYTSGNESRMGKGKGSFDHWTARVAVSKVIFEIKGDLHEQVVRDAFRLAGNKLPGEFFLLVAEMVICEASRSRLTRAYRIVRIRKEGRPARYGTHKGRRQWRYGGGPEEAEEEAASGRESRKIALGDRIDFNDYPSVQ